MGKHTEVCSGDAQDEHRREDKDVANAEQEVGQRLNRELVHALSLGLSINGPLEAISQPRKKVPDQQMVSACFLCRYCIPRGFGSLRSIADQTEDKDGGSQSVASIEAVSVEHAGDEL